MQAFEFHAKPKDGIIQIPEQFRSQVAEQVFVIVLEHKPIMQNSSAAEAQRKANSIRKSDLLLPPTLDTRGWKFDREEANER